MNLPYIFVSDTPEIDLSSRDSMLEFVFSHHDKKIPKYVLEMKDFLSYEKFMELCKVFWVSGKWEMKELPEAEYFSNLVSSLKKEERVYRNTCVSLINSLPSNSIELRLIDFLSRVKNPDTGDKTNYSHNINVYRNIYLSAGKYDFNLLNKKIYRFLNSNVDNISLRLLNFLLDLYKKY